MKIELPGFDKIAIYWSHEEIERAIFWLVKLSLTGIESQDRLLIQDCIDNQQIEAIIHYHNNRVRPYRKTIEEYNNLLKFWVRSLSMYLYDFFCTQWTIKHYDIAGWMTNYINIEDIKNLVANSTVAEWKTDVQKIKDWFLSLH